MQESCPACGGSTSVGTTSSVAPSEKSRKRATGHSRTMRFGECQRGRSRLVASCVQRAASSHACHGVRVPRRSAAVQYCSEPVATARAISAPDSRHLAASAGESARAEAGGRPANGTEAPLSIGYPYPEWVQRNAGWSPPPASGEGGIHLEQRLALRGRQVR